MQYTESDKAFTKTFAAVLGILVLIAIGIAIAAGSIYNPAEEARATDPRVTQNTTDRIAPIGKVNTGEPRVAAASPTVAAAQPAAAANAEPRGGEAVYNLACMACHSAGVAGAPKLGDKSAWAGRMAKGMETLVSNAINGIGAMPAKGGNPTLSDTEVENAVQYMVDQS